MSNIKEMFNNVRTKINESKIMTNIKGFFVKILKNEKLTSEVSKRNEDAKNFSENHKNLKDGFSGNVTERFSSKIKKFFKNILRKIQKSSDDGNRLSKICAIVIKVLCIIAAAAFIGIVIYFIKDVFLHCIMLVAMCLAVAISIELILSILSVATGCRI